MEIVGDGQCGKGYKLAMKRKISMCIEYVRMICRLQVGKGIDRQSAAWPGVEIQMRQFHRCITTDDMDSDVGTRSWEKCFFNLELKK